MKSILKETAATCGFTCLFFISRLLVDLRHCLQSWVIRGLYRSWAPFSLKPPLLLPCIIQRFFCERVKGFVSTKEPGLSFSWIQSKWKFSVLKFLMGVTIIRFSKDRQSAGKRHQLDFVIDA